MTLSLKNLKPVMKRASRQRVGRGLGSGRGAYSGRGIKGQKARTGGKIPPGFEGGRMPLIRQIPKLRGFKSFYPKPQALDLKLIAKVFSAGEVVSLKSLAAKGLVRIARGRLVKIVSSAELNKKLVFAGLKLSAKAREAVEKAGGEIKT